MRGCGGGVCINSTPNRYKAGGRGSNPCRGNIISFFVFIVLLVVEITEQFCRQDKMVFKSE